MFQRLLFTLATAIGLFGLFALYSAALKPVVVVAVRSESAGDTDAFTVPQRPVENVRIAEAHVPFRRWAAESKYMLRADQAWIYTNSVHRTKGSNKGITFEPFAMVWITNDKDGHEQAISMVSDGSAEIEFKDDFDAKSPTPGRVVKAFLKGAVEIAGPDGLSIIGQNFIFNEADLKLFTTNPVKFRLKSHRGSASRMEMSLIPAKGLPGKDRPHVYGVDSLRLIASPTRLVQLEAQLPPGSTSKSVKLKCAGELEYTVAAKSAVFTRDITAWTGPKDKFDKLDCDKLTMQFESKSHPPEIDSNAATSELADPSSPANSYQQLDADLELKWLKAEGKRVRIVSKSQGIRAEMSLLTYDAGTRNLQMISQGTRSNVEVFQSQEQSRTEIRVPKIEARLNLQSQLELLLCHGAGIFKYLDLKANNQAFSATWEKQLRLQTGIARGLDLVELEGRAKFLQPDRKIGLTAELIKIQVAGLNLNVSPMSGDSQETKNAPAPEPKRMLALRDVGFTSPQMEIKKTNELDVRFENDSDSKVVTTSQKARSQLKPAAITMPNGKSPERSSVRVSANRASKGAGSSSIGFANVPPASDGVLGPPVEIPFDDLDIRPSAKRPEKPVLVTANRISVLMKRVAGSSEPVWSDIQTDGNVELTQERVPGEKPVKLAGDWVEVRRETENREVVHVYGKPALIRDQRFEIEGNEIHLDRGDNRTWVSGSGRLKLQIPDGTALPGQEAGASRDLNVRWGESMNFDGLDAKFIGSIDARFGKGSMRCEQMTVRLMESLSFQSNPANAQPAIRTIHCRENVNFKNAMYDGKKLIDIYRGKVGEFTWNHATGKVDAQGPGTIQAWRRKLNAGSGFAPNDVVQANRPIPVEISEWEYTRVKFEGRLKGHIDGEVTSDSSRRTATIDDRVEVIHGPVDLPNENDTVNPDDLPSKAGTIRCDQLQIVNHPKTDRNPGGYTELVGKGNSEVEGQVNGRRFNASADEISFDGSKGLYILKANGRQSARLTELQSGSMAGQQIDFNPERKYIHVVRATEGRGSMSR